MIGLPKLLLTALVLVAVFYGLRWLRRTAAGGGVPARRGRPGGDRVIDLERNPETGAYEPRERPKEGGRDRR